MLAVKFFHLLSLVVWLGSVVFFSLIVAPSLFKALPEKEAGRAVSAIFSKYYRVGIVCSLVALTTAIGLAPFSARLAGVEIILLAVMGGSVFYSNFWLRPRLSSLRQELQETTEVSIVADLKGRFHKAHQSSVRFNLLVVICGLVVILIDAASLHP